MTTPLEKEEKDILESFDNDEWQSVPIRASEMKWYQEYAAEMLKNSQRIHIQISTEDFAVLKTRASKEGMSYQALVSTVLHKYALGLLIEKDA